MIRRTATTMAAVAVVFAAVFGLTPAAHATIRAPHQLVVVAAIPDLTLADVASMPHLRALMTASSVGLLADKTAAGSTGCLAGLVTIDSGSRSSNLPGKAADDCDDTDPVELEKVNDSNAYAVDPTALGTALAHAGVARIVNSNDAFAMLNGPSLPSLTIAGGGHSMQIGQLIRQLATHPIGKPVVLGLLARELANYTSGPRDRAAVDQWIGAIVRAVPANALLLVVGSSDATNSSSALHLVIAHGPGFPAGKALTSASTGRSSYAELIDIAPTVAAAVGVTLPSSVVGSRLRATDNPAMTLRQMIDANRHAVADIEAAVVIRTLAIVLTALALIFAGLVWWRGARFTATALVLARVAAPVVALSWLAQLLPWWRAGTAWLTAGIVVLAVAYAVAVTLLQRRGAPAWLDLLAMPVVATVALSVDQIAGGGLQLSAPLGDDPLEAGRFTGVGNTDFAVLVSSALLVAVVMGAWSKRMIPAAGLLVLVVVIDGAPSLGDDLGGVLASVPAVLICLALLAGITISWRKVVVVLILGVAVAALAAGLDYSRPAVDQTHLGHFVGELLHGGGGTTLHRKIVGDLKLQGELPLVLAAIAWLTRRRWLPWLTELFGRVPGLGIAATGVGVLAILGSLLNDSGVTVAVFCLVAVLPSVLAALLAPDPLNRSPVAATVGTATD